jgi:hypothetical protein
MPYDSFSSLSWCNRFYNQEGADCKDLDLLKVLRNCVRELVKK